MIINIYDDFDLQKIADSGQCFRAKEIESGLFRFITGNHVVYIRQVDKNSFDVECHEHDWERIWEKYFDFETNYMAIRYEIQKFAEKISFGNYLNAAADFGTGIRILRQDPFETLVSFIISQRKSIPAIKKSVELICDGFGEIIHTPHEDIRTFPTPEKLSAATTLGLSHCALGYRGSYVRDAIEKVRAYVVDLEDLFHSKNDDMIIELKEIKGVGDKIANCVALYAYHRLNLAPVDVWIKRAIDEDFHGVNIFAEFGEHAGILQQYIFYYKRLGDKEFELVD